ncbi:Maneal [Symbiodinium sp. CCMP2456]|nr:Maneal [Symbiodinium sp. CCMP2456]
MFAALSKLCTSRLVRSEEASEEVSATSTPTCTRADGSVPAVHAAFYLWYGTPEVDGKWLHWDHKVLPHWDKEVDAKYDKFNWSPPDEPHATFYPDRGPYSSSDESILLSQFEDLAKAGVDSAMCSWWGRKAFLVQKESDLPFLRPCAAEDWAGKRDDADSGFFLKLCESFASRARGKSQSVFGSRPQCFDMLQAAVQAGVFVQGALAFCFASPCFHELRSFHIEPYGGRSPQTPWPLSALRLRRCFADVRFLDDLAYIVREYGHHPAIWREVLRSNPASADSLFAKRLGTAIEMSANATEALDSVRGTELDGVRWLEDSEFLLIALWSSARCQAARAVQALEEVIGTSTSVEELNRFLRLGFDSKRPLVAPKARQEQLLLLRSIVRQFHSLGGEDTSAATAALKDQSCCGMPQMLDRAKLLKGKDEHHNDKEPLLQPR